MTARQLGLFGGEPLEVDSTFGSGRRIDLGGGAWVDFFPAWLAGSDRLFEHLFEGAEWRAGEREMYRKTVVVPRLMTVLPPARRVHPMVDAIRVLLDRRYATDFARISAALYRDGNDSVAWHGDYVARRMSEALVATVSLGGARRFLVRKTGGGSSTALELRGGDLVVMGGTAQRTHQHCVPKVSRASPRIALMYRPIWDDADATH